MFSKILSNDNKKKSTTIRKTNKNIGRIKKWDIKK
jgi:hypothetical protein